MSIQRDNEASKHIFFFQRTFLIFGKCFKVYRKLPPAWGIIWPSEPPRWGLCWDPYFPFTERGLELLRKFAQCRNAIQQEKRPNSHSGFLTPKSVLPHSLSLFLCLWSFNSLLTCSKQATWKNKQGDIKNVGWPWHYDSFNPQNGIWNFSLIKSYCSSAWSGWGLEWKAGYTLLSLSLVGKPWIPGNSRLAHSHPCLHSRCVFVLFEDTSKITIVKEITALIRESESPLFDHE